VRQNVHRPPLSNAHLQYGTGSERRLPCSARNHGSAANFACMAARWNGLRGGSDNGGQGVRTAGRPIGRTTRGRHYRVRSDQYQVSTSRPSRCRARETQCHRDRGAPDGGRRSERPCATAIKWATVSTARLWDRALAGHSGGIVRPPSAPRHPPTRRCRSCVSPKYHRHDRSCRPRIALRHPYYMCSSVTAPKR